MANHRLLLIEDDMDVAEMLLMYFQSIDYEVLHADNGTEGIEIARTKFPNLILLDVMLPDMDGYETCIRLRSTSLTKYIPTLFLTQKDERSSKVKGLELGADDYITKPFDIDELRLRVEKAIRRATNDNLHEPRTGLPSGQLLEDERQRRLSAPNFKELKFQLHHFGEYEDVYSFMAASDVLFHAGKTIRESLIFLNRADDFVGVDKEIFVVMTTLEDTTPLETRIRDTFNEQVKAFYSYGDAQRGGISLKKDDGTERFIPLMSLTTGAPSPLSSKPQDDSGSGFTW